jgi:hypothetical protein
MELKEIESKLRAEAARGNAIQEWYRMLYAPKMGYRILLGVGLQMFQQLTGANYFFYYGTVIFQGTGISNSFVTQMILNGINFGMVGSATTLDEQASLTFYARNDFLRSLHRRTLRPEEVSYYWSMLDVHHVLDLC